MKTKRNIKKGMLVRYNDDSKEPYPPSDDGALAIAVRPFTVAEGSRSLDGWWYFWLTGADCGELLNCEREHVEVVSIG